MQIVEIGLGLVLTIAVSHIGSGDNKANVYHNDIDPLIIILCFHNLIVNGNSTDKLRHTRSVELVVLNKQQISGGRAYLDCYLVNDWTSMHVCACSVVTLSNGIGDIDIVSSRYLKPTRGQSSHRQINSQTSHAKYLMENSAYIIAFKHFFPVDSSIMYTQYLIWLGLGLVYKYSVVFP